MMRFTAGGAEGREEKKKEKGAGWREARPPSATEEIKHTLPLPLPAQVSYSCTLLEGGARYSSQNNKTALATRW